jgi:hypothetical protein
MRIKNWTKFQHFKDRRPPWVKLYRDILDDLEWHELDPLAAKVLVMLWLIASEDDGRIPDTKTLAFRLRLTEVKTKEIVSKLSHWLEQDDINLISTGYQLDLPERETETEIETKKEKNATGVACPPDVDQQIWDDWKQLRKAKKAPVTETVVKSARKEAAKANMAFGDFLSIWCARGSQGLQADWIKPDERNLTKTGQRNADVLSGLTRGLLGGQSNVKLLGN